MGLNIRPSVALGEQPIKKNWYSSCILSFLRIKFYKLKIDCFIPEFRINQFGLTSVEA